MRVEVYMTLPPTNKETVKEQECECGIDDQGNWSDNVFDRFGCECEEERS